ncbi:mannan-binding lectin [Aliamphritea spongicola]|uniref:mannan-binding lectin n=1 Tax=Aliamphritea spongicola TaxID=707589 RepID=UPI00196B3BBC|nr:mannan-binding lectin [Aliamphritea spongicola]MBN3561591.1 mannan-binding lectin [Aliamphritea spongicola]
MSSYKVSLPAGPIWNQADAEKKAPMIAAAHQGVWTGVWNTVVDGKMSVVEVELSDDQRGENELVTTVPAGPLWSDDEAQEIGPVLAASYGAEFTGRWESVVQGQMSIIEIRYVF